MVLVLTVVCTRRQQFPVLLEAREFRTTRFWEPSEHGIRSGVVENWAAVITGIAEDAQVGADSSTYIRPTGVHNVVWGSNRNGKLGLGVSQVVVPVMDQATPDEFGDLVLGLVRISTSEQPVVSSVAMVKR